MLKNISTPQIKKDSVKLSNFNIYVYVTVNVDNSVIL